MSRMFGSTSRFSVPKETEAFRVVDTNELAQRKIQEALEKQKISAPPMGEDFDIDETNESPEFSSLFENPETAPEYIEDGENVLGDDDNFREFEQFAEGMVAENEEVKRIYLGGKETWISSLHN